MRQKLLRRALITLAWLIRGVPSCLASTSPGDVVDIEGRFKPALLVPLVAGVRLRRCRLAFSPHTTFARDGRRSVERLVRWMARRADVVFSLSDFDVPRMRAWGVQPVRVPLFVAVSPPRPDAVAAWRARWHAVGQRPVVLFAGQIREDKGLDVLVRAAALAVQPLAVAVVGEDVGALARARQLAAELGVELVVDEGFQPLDRFVAALAAADVVVCPYRVSSMSAVATMARALGRPTVVTDAGGLPEVGTAVVPPDDPAALAEAVDCALKDAAVLVPDLTPPDVRPFLRPFGLVTAAPQP